MRTVNLFFACTVSLFLSLTGCVSNHTASNSSDRGARRDGAMVTSPLTVSTLRPELLASINSIDVAQPVFKQSASAGAISPQDAYGIISNAARETMTLKVFGADAARAGHGLSGANSQADAVLRTEILRFDERSGSAFGGEPAVVSFRMAMYSRAARADMWSAQYFLKQEALSENLLRIGERKGLGAGWSTAHDVFKKGVNEALQDFNSQREQRFLAGNKAGSGR